MSTRVNLSGMAEKQQEQTPEQRYLELRESMNAHLDAGTLTREVWIQHLRDALAAGVELGRLGAFVELGALENLTSGPADMAAVIASLKDPPRSS